LMKKRPYTPVRRSSNLLPWLVTVYLGLFTITFQRYESQLTRLSNTTNVLIERMGESPSPTMIQNLIYHQDSEIPVEPEFHRPQSVVRSLIAKEPYRQLISDINAVIDEPFHSYITNSEDAFYTFYNLQLPKLKVENANAITLNLANSTFWNISIKASNGLLNNVMNAHYLDIENSYIEAIDRSNAYDESLRDIKNYIVKNSIVKHAGNRDILSMKVFGSILKLQGDFIMDEIKVGSWKSQNIGSLIIFDKNKKIQLRRIDNRKPLLLINLNLVHNLDQLSIRERDSLYLFNCSDANGILKNDLSISEIRHFSSDLFQSLEPSAGPGSGKNAIDEFLSLQRLN